MANWLLGVMTFVFCTYVFVVPSWTFLTNTWRHPGDIFYVLLLLGSGLAMNALASKLIGVHFKGRRFGIPGFLLTTYFGMCAGYLLFRQMGVETEIRGETFYSLILMRSFVGCYVVALIRIAWNRMVGLKNMRTIKER